MEHWLVTIAEGQSDAALDWAARHAVGRAGLEVIASDLEVHDPRGAILHAETRLEAAGHGVPRALHSVSTSLAERLAGVESVDLIVLGSPRGPLSAAETDRLLRLLRGCRSAVVLVPDEGSADGVEPPVIEWPMRDRRPPAELRARIRMGGDPLRIERTPPHRPRSA